MMPITLLRAACVAFVLLVALPAQAQRATADDDYAEAMRLIAENRPAEAAALLERIVETTPEHAGALLDLAIVQCAQGQADAAMRLLDVLTARFTPPPAIAAAIDALRARGCAPATVHTAPTRSLTLGRGYDSNASQGTNIATLTVIGFDGAPVELPLSTDYRPRADSFTLVAAEYSGTLPWPDKAANEARGFVQLHARNHDSLGQYDTTALLAGVEQPWRLGAWQGRAAVALGALRLGGRLYQRQARLHLQGVPPLTLPTGLRVQATAELAHIRYPGLHNFDSSTGEAGGLLEWRGERVLLRASASVTKDRATADRPGGDRSGWRAAAQARFTLPWGNFGDLTASRRVWRGAEVYAPGLINRRRDQTMDSVVFRLTRPLTASQAVFAELHWLKSRERIAVFGHESGQLTLGWEWWGK